MCIAWFAREETEPEPTEQNLVELCEQVRRHSAAVGFAQGPDADRLAIADEAAQYIGEEYTPVLAAKSILSRRAGVAVINLASSRMIDDVAMQTGSTVLRTPVGEANVVQAMLESGAVIGGEGGGG